MVGSSGTPEPEQAATPPPPPEQQPHLSVPLKSLVESWPEAIQNEVLQQQLLNAKVALPALTVSEQLKHGRVCFTWDVLRSWMSPKPAASTEYGERTLELPLKVVAPLFLGIKNGEPKSQRLVADQQIPDVFAPVAKPAAAAAPVASPAPATVAKAEPAPIVPPLEKTPEALVARAAALKGVAGALIALPDGLVVASRLPAGLNGENLAAFLPQVYSKFDAGLRALNMGALGDLNFTAGGVPWRVFRTHKLFFAVFGRGTEPLPGESLTALAKELE